MPKAKNRKHTPRRVSGTKSGNSVLMMIVGGVGGYVIGNAINTQLTTVDGKIKAGAEIGLPVLLGKKLKSPIAIGAAVGLAIAGVKAAGKEFNIPMLAGMPTVSGYVGRSRRRVNGYPAVAGSADQPYLRTGAAGNSMMSGIPAKTLTDEQVYAGVMMDDHNDK